MNLTFHCSGTNNVFLGKDGEIVYSKNNVCVHESSDSSVGVSLQNRLNPIHKFFKEVDEDNVLHTPGYLTIHCLNDEQIGVTLVLQWLPNATLEKNPASIRCVSPRGKRPENKEATNRANHRVSRFEKNFTCLKFIELKIRRKQ